MDKPNTLEITATEIVLATPKGRQYGGRLDGNAVMFGKTAIRFSPELVAEITMARAAYRSDTVRNLHGTDLADARARGLRVLDAWTANDAYEEAAVLVEQGTGPVVVRFAKSDLV